MCRGRAADIATWVVVVAGDRLVKLRHEYDMRGVAGGGDRPGGRDERVSVRRENGRDDQGGGARRLHGPLRRAVDGREDPEGGGLLPRAQDEVRDGRDRQPTHRQGALVVPGPPRGFACSAEGVSGRLRRVASPLRIRRAHVQLAGVDRAQRGDKAAAGGDVLRMRDEHGPLHAEDDRDGEGAGRAGALRLHRADGRRRASARRTVRRTASSPTTAATGRS